MKKLLKIIMTISQILLITIGLAGLLLLAIPMIFGYKPYVVKSGSMEPTIHTGAIAYNNSRAKIEDIHEGDIIVFQQGDMVVTHRVVKINEDKTFTTKGDANETEDTAPVKKEQYRGKNIFSIPYLGYLLQIVQNKICIFILVLLVGVNIIYMIFSDDEEKDKKEKKA